jgi:hypothetical protein
VDRSVETPPAEVGWAAAFATLVESSGVANVIGPFDLTRRGFDEHRPTTERDLHIQGLELAGLKSRDCGKCSAG